MFRITGSFSDTVEPVLLPELAAIPEPGSMLLFAAGLAAMGIGRIRRKFREVYQCPMVNCPQPRIIAA